MPEKIVDEGSSDGAESRRLGWVAAWKRAKTGEAAKSKDEEQSKGTSSKKKSNKEQRRLEKEQRRLEKEQKKKQKKKAARAARRAAKRRRDQHGYPRFTRLTFLGPEAVSGTKAAKKREAELANRGHGLQTEGEAGVCEGHVRLPADV